MIKKLRRKFVLINASLIFLIFISILFAFAYSLYYKQEQAGYNRLELVLERGYKTGDSQMDYTDRAHQQYNTEPGFCVKVDAQGNAVLTDMQYYTEVSTEMLAQAVEYASQANADKDFIGSMQLRYVRMNTQSGLRIAFADISAELEQTNGYIGIGIAVLIGGLAIVLGLAWLLAEFSIRPVERAWVQQKQFIADASHEIKTPLTIILTNTGLLLGHQQDTIAAQRKWVDYIQVEAERMKELVENMLFLAKSDAGKELHPYADADLSELVWNSTLPFESVAYEKGLAIVNDIAQNVQIYGNTGQLKQLISILLDNACKHSPAGGEITVRLTSQQDRVELSVNNAAAEVIPKEKLAHIFDRFYRADEARDREAGGYGLGLAIAKTIAEQHGARIWAESTAQDGVTIFVDFSKNGKLRAKRKTT